MDDNEKALFVEDAWKSPEEFRAHWRGQGFHVLYESDLFEQMRFAMRQEGEPPEMMTASALRGMLHEENLVQVGPFWIFLLFDKNGRPIPPDTDDDI